jgi:serine/threonine protein kinase
VNFSNEIKVSESAKDFVMNCLQKNAKERSTIRELMEHQFLNQIDRFRWTIV